MAVTKEQFDEALELMLSSPQTRKALRDSLDDDAARADPALSAAMKQLRSVDFTKMPDGHRKMAAEVVARAAQELAQFANLQPDRRFDNLTDGQRKFAATIRMPGNRQSAA
jgi:hypothetical protein